MPGTEMIYEKLDTNGKEDHNDDLIEKIHFLENKTKFQDTEVNLLKCALSDALSRLSTLEVEMTTLKDRAKTDKHPSPRSTINNPSSPSKKNFTPLTITNGNTNGTTRNGRKSSILKSSSSTEPRSPTNKQKVTKRALSGEIKSTPSRNTTSAKRVSMSAAEARPAGIPYSHDASKEKTDDGKPKLILAKKPSLKKKVSRNLSMEDSACSPPKEDSVKFYMRGRGMTFQTPSEDIKINGTAPEEKLQLSWVYGYRGKDSRENLFILPSGELLYNMAGVVVMYDEKNQTQRHYTKHTDDVKCIALHPDKTLVASGQVAGHGDEGKPHVLVWNSVTMETISSFGHGVFERGLCGVSFSHAENGKYIAAIDESNEHVITIWDWEKQQKIAETKCSKEVVLGVKWSCTSNFSFVTYGKSLLAFWTFNPELKMLTKKTAIYDKYEKPKYVLSAIYTPNGDIISGDSSGNILLFADGYNRVSKSAKPSHKGGVFALTLLSDGNTVSCCKDGQFTIWNSNLEKIKDVAKMSDQYGNARCILFDQENDSYLVGTAKNCVLQYCASEWENEKVIVQGHSDEMWGLTTHPIKSLFATCSQEMMVCLWDGETSDNLWAYAIEDAAQCIDFHPTQPYLVVGTKSGTIYVLDYESKEELITLPVSRELIDDIKVSPDGKYFAVTSRDTNIYLYRWPEDVTNFKKPKILQGHSSRVLHLDWSIDSEFMQSNSSDYELLYWHTESGCQVLSPAALRDTSWATWTCPIGFPVMGIWPEGADGTDINTCSRSHNKQLVATGDDFGDVRMFRYPSVKLRSESQVGTGHSSHVTNVRFLSQDAGLITVGGNDCSIMKWNLVQ